jgi:hypothetical protein
MIRAAARAVTTVVLSAAIVSPVAREPRWDSFPISSFPMFSRGNLGSVVALGHAVLVTEDGARRPAVPTLVGTPEPMVAKNLVEGAIARGAAFELCARIAARAVGEAPDARSVEIVTSVFDTRRYFEDPRPVSREVHASCEVHR